MAHDADRGAFERAEVELALGKAFELGHDEEIESVTVARGRGVDDGARGLVAEDGRVDGLSRLRSGRRHDVRERHAPLEDAAVLGPRDDLLPWVAALLEAHAADQLEIGHL